MKRPKITRKYFSPPIDGCDFVFVVEGVPLVDYLVKTERRKKYEQ